MTWGRAVRRLRLPLGFLLGGLYLAFAHPKAGSLLLGAGVSLAGVLIRAWASGHIVKNDRLATTGPYAHTRNPLYLGSFLIAAGFAIAAHWSLLLLVIVFFVLVYGPTIQQERDFVHSKFPDAYNVYEQNVPVFFPRPLPWRDSSGETSTPFSYSLYLRHSEWQVALVYLLALLWLFFRMRPSL